MLRTGLVLSGGGAKGAFQVGALKKLNMKYDFISGVSTGALQGCMIAQDKLDELEELWRNLKKNSDIYKKSWWKIAFNRFPYRFTGLKKLLEKHVDDKYTLSLHVSGSAYETHFSVGIVSMVTGDYYSVMSPSVSHILASCSIPILFEPVHTISGEFVDGGVRNVTPLKEAIDAGCDKIYIILCDNRLDSKYDFRLKWRFLSSLKRTLDIMVSEIKQNDLIWADIDNAERVNDLVRRKKSDKRDIKFIVIEPSKGFMDNVDSLEFNQRQIERCYDHGYKRA